jgi:hypothetical protein
VYGELWGSVAILSISAVIPLVSGLFGHEAFDFDRLKRVADATESSRGATLPASAIRVTS